MFADATSKTMMLIPQKVVKNDKQVQKYIIPILVKVMRVLLLEIKILNMILKVTVCNALKIKNLMNKNLKL